MTNVNLLSCSGKKRSGKNTVATIINKLISEKHGYTYEEKAFAFLVKTFASMLTGIPIEGWETEEDKAKNLGPEWMTFDELGIRQQMSRRLMLKKLGSDACNQNLHPNCWVNGVFQNWDENKKWIITDVRFPQEVKAVRNRGGVVIRVTRKATDNAGDTHISETALDNYDGFDYVIHNDGTIEDLENQVRKILVELGII